MFRPFSVIRTSRGSFQLRKSAIESLEPRQMLSNDPLTVGAYKIGTATWLNIIGSANDDTIVVQRTAATAYRITNGEWSLNKVGTFAGVRVLGGAGADAVSTAGTLNFYLKVYGEAGNDTLTGGNLNDYLGGGADDDSIVGGAGNDSLLGEPGNDVLAGGIGNDLLVGGEGNELLTGGDGNDSLTGDAGADSISGEIGNDTLIGGTEDDQLSGGEGNDQLRGDSGFDTLDGEGGNDVLNGGADADALDGGAGNDTLNGDAGNDTVTGATGADLLNGGADDDSVNGGADNDKVVGDAGNDVYIGGTGNDTVDYTGRLVGLTLSLDGIANDGASGETDNIADDFEYVVGGSAADSIIGNGSVNYFYGGLGSDTIEGAGGNDKIYGGAGLDSLSGGAGNDSIWGQADADKLFGNDGEDLLEGGAGNDQYEGGAGRDRLIALGGGVADSLTGGDGLDSYWLDKDVTEMLLDVSEDETAARATHRVATFMKYGTMVISKEITGQKLAEPVRHTKVSGRTLNAKIVSYASNKLFADGGPSIDDIKQGLAGDCWFLSSMAGIADVNAETIRQSVTDLGDGTYAARFYNTANRSEIYVRIDADLYTYSSTASTPIYAGLGGENSTWVALMEKAFTWVHGSKLGQYLTYDGGAWMGTAYSRFGLTNQVGGNGVSADATSMVDRIRDLLDAGHTVTIGTKGSVGYNMVGGHAYTVSHVTDNGDGTCGIVLRNPWGVDNYTSTDSSNDGYVTLTPTQLFATYSGLAAA